MSLLAAVWATAASGAPGLVIGLELLFVAATAVPLLVVADSVAFRRASLGTAVFLLAFGVVGAHIGLFAYIPAAMLLLAARWTDQRSNPRLTTAVVGAGLAVGVALTLVYGVTLARVWATAHAACQGGYLVERLLPDEEFRVDLDRPVRDGDGDRLTQRILALSEVESMASSGSDRASLRVFPRESASVQDKVRLKERLEALPGVVAVDLCRY
jgi:hypothetical protein